ncbi:MAG TPA: alpha/beta hydrolase [Cyclobacteriaceae bacterium]|nr:alpha/beta hydrolase [Cyclobacteriaceae bacterium]
MKTILLSALILILGSSFVYAQRDSVGYSAKIYKHVDSTDLVVHIFTPPAALNNNKNKTAIAFFHGGGWAFGNPDEFFGACKRFAAKGIVTFSFQYRLSVDKQGNSPHPGITPVECVMDARSALRWVKTHTSEFGIDPKKIVAGGQSVGGHLTLSTAMIDVNESTDDPKIDPTPCAMLLYSGTVNTLEVWCDMLMGKQREKIWSISPAHNIKTGLPPALAFHGEQDHTVYPWVVLYFQRDMQAAGNVFEVQTFPRREHYLGEGNEKYSRLFDEEIMERTDEFLKKLGLL